MSQNKKMDYKGRDKMHLLGVTEEWYQGAVSPGIR